MSRRVVRTAGQRLAAREAEEGSDRLGMRLDRCAGSVGGLCVVAGLVQGLERRPGLEAENLVSGRYGAPSSSISSIASKRVTE